VTCDGITAVTFTVHAGEVTTQNALNALRTDNVQALVGGIGLISPSSFDLGDPGVFEVMTGTVNVQCGAPTELVRVRAPALRDVGGGITIENCDTDPFSLNLNVLTHVGGAFSVSNSAALGSISIPELQTVGGAFAINNNARLLTVDLRSLQSIGLAGGDLDDFTFNSNATALSLGTLSVEMPAARARVFGNISITANNRFPNPAGATLASKLNNEGFNAPIVVNNQ
jgi:hypothetical protein